ncbi:hypothetical protein G3T14_04915 [Methylobacterium sp. BTF04]|uniref:hypothetical protein n=1 Tax=Methylobacterium sp. BTF04 TaxID=2708300 RepID=UPI0013D5402A|nr:hypothetical protein [Methylobacterium sp. BTF04]NEU11467.1 hypothetical protein [Methylobacterium sp. BTF04]
MKPSKLEAFYVETFGARDVAPDARPEPSVRRDERPRQKRERSGFGRRLVVRLGLMFAPMAILGAVAMTTDCSRRSPTSMIPEILRSTACARQGLMTQSSALEGTFRTISDHLR